MSVLSLARGVRDYMDGRVRSKDLDIPWWAPLLSAAGIAAVVVVAVLQREAAGPYVLAGMLVVVPSVSMFFIPNDSEWLKYHMWVIDLVPTLIGSAWLMSEPATAFWGQHDFAPGVLVPLTLEMVVREGFRTGTFYAIVSTLVMWGFAADSPSGIGMHLLLLVVAWILGLLILAQMRALRAERLAREQEHSRATEAERTRIAREIHDLVGHSLSITLLHLTAARRSVAEGDDPDETVAALTEAETVGRRAMAEIRRTIGVLSASGSGTSPLPTATDVIRLVEEGRSAGQSITFSTTGDLSEVDTSIGLGVYRILQESLANAIRHAPGAPVSVSLAVDEGVRLSVRNPLVGPRRSAGEGSGLAGMAARAEQLRGRLSAGADDTDGSMWKVDLVIPPHCLVRKALA
ncbi:signal transduction histidine kinase [Nocardioides albertanoniae]|uniref:histidine kinase n=1 Tax=Nocardioides albertanoniae TaxID=1175486 RepID=A0A543A0V9_9ACTN|nr:histidine kinase [Nocardioides albertanoniae]TQL66232.1 signal transduction histidine kinase [Nocardioides albertanoniae]